jgi:hypothetical protein
MRDAPGAGRAARSASGRSKDRPYTVGAGGHIGPPLRAGRMGAFGPGRIKMRPYTVGAGGHIGPPVHAGAQCAMRRARAGRTDLKVCPYETDGYSPRSASQRW